MSTVANISTSRVIKLPSTTLVKYSKNKVAGIYCIYNKITGDGYIGSATSLYDRKQQHLSKLGKQKLQTFESVVSASSTLGISETAISRAAKGIRNRKGLNFKFV